MSTSILAIVIHGFVLTCWCLNIIPKSKRFCIEAVQGKLYGRLSGAQNLEFAVSISNFEFQLQINILTAMIIIDVGKTIS